MERLFMLWFSVVASLRLDVGMSLKEILALPIIIDKRPLPVTLTVHEGDDVQRKLEELQRLYHLTRENVAILSDTIQTRVAKSGSTLLHRWYVVLASATKPVRSRSEAREALLRSLVGICRHSVSDSFNVVVVLDGFSLASQDEVTTMLKGCGVDRLSFVETEEWEGLSSALNRAFVGVIPERSIVAIIPWGMELRQGNENDDVFLAYERLARSYGRDGVPFYIEEQMERWLAQMPLVVVTSSSFSHFDEGYQYFGGIAKWLDSRGAIPAPHEWFDNFLVADGARDTLHQNDEEEYDGELLIPTAPPTYEHERLQQLDLDAYYIAATANTIAGNSCDSQETMTTFKLRTSEYLSSQRWQHKNMRVAAMICIYDDVRFIEALVEDLFPIIHAAIVLHSNSPWYGDSRPKTHAYAAQVLSRIAANPKVSLIRGSWPSEEAQRNFGMRIANMQSMTHVLLVDGDEFWHPAELDRALSLIAGRQTPVGWARASMATYWKSTRTVVSPPEPLQILWLVATHSTIDCQFADARNWACSTTNFSTAADLAAQIDALGVFLDRSTAICHHLSYVRTTSELNDKMTSFAHAEDVRSGWMDDVWHRWDDDHHLKNLHPTHPSAFAGTINRPLWSLPPALRRLSIRGTCNQSSRLYCRLLRGPESNASHLDLGRRLPSVEPIAIRHAVDDAQRRVHQEEGDDDSAGLKRVNWEMISHRHYVSDVPVADIEESEMVLIADDDFPRCPDLPEKDGPRFILLIVGEGSLDASTLGVFEDIANVVRDALLTLGASSASIRWCPDLRFCSFRSKAFVVVFGIHHLARYFYNNANKSTFLVEHFGWPDPSASVLYNFEQTGLSHDLSPGGSLWRLFSSRRYKIWDYSAANVLRMARHGFHAQHVPLGYGESLEAGRAKSLIVKKDIDVLFVGRLADGDKRTETLRSLRERGLNVLHGNSNGPLFGSRLRDHLTRAKIVLSLNYWSNDSEWKMTRFLPALAHGAVIVSERGGAPEEVAAWDGAIVFVSRDDIFDTCQLFLNSPSLREEQAIRGRSILLRRLAADSLASPVSRWLQDLCPTWTMAYNQNNSSDVWQWNLETSNGTHSLVPARSEYSGHPVEQLKEVIAGLRGSKESLVFLVGDSSLDNKYWLARQEAAVNGYEELLRPAQSVCDVTHFMNRELNRRDPSRACVNCAIEATTLNQRGMGRLLPQDRLVRDSIRPEDVLIVSVGGNDIALAPLLCTCCNIIPLLCCLACSGGEDDFCCCRARACPPDIYTFSGGYTDCACCCCGLPGCVVGICGWPPGLGYFVDLFGNRIRSYVSRLVSKKKPRLVVVCMIYHLDVRGRGSWADTTLNLLGYNHNPRLLQKAIKLVFERGTKGIEIQGTKVLPFPLFQVLDGSDTDDYVQRVEPSVQGGSKMAAALVDHVLAQQQAQPSSPDHHRMHARVKQRYNAT